jgi:hypothetical protein
MGPNVKKLIAHKMSLDAVPPGGGLKSALDFLTKPGAIAASGKAGTEWVMAAIVAIRTAAEPNPWKNADDEQIAGEVLRRIGERKQNKQNFVRS